MKKFLPTILLVAVCAAGLWYASSHSLFKPKAAAETKQLLDLKAADIQTVKIRNGADTIEMARKNDSWEMAKPQPLPVEKFGADGWAETFAQLGYAEKIEDNPSNLAEYGLDKPIQEFEALLKDGTSKKLAVGKPLPVAGSSYAKLADSPAVYSVSDQTLQSLAKKPLDFMVKNPVSLEYDKVTKVSLNWKGAQWQLEKKDTDKKAYEANWKLGSKDLKPEEGSGILDRLVGFATDRPAKPASEAKADKPDLTLEVVQDTGGKASSVIYSGKIDGDAVWLSAQGSEWAFAIPTDKIQELADQGK